MYVCTYLICYLEMNNKQLLNITINVELTTTGDLYYNYVQYIVTV